MPETDNSHRYQLRIENPNSWETFKAAAVRAGYANKNGEAYDMSDLIMQILAEWSAGRQDGGSLEELLGSSLYDWVIKYARRRNQSPQDFVRKAVAYACGQADTERFNAR